MTLGAAQLEVRKLQLVVASLALGAFSFLGVTALLALTQPPPQPQPGSDPLAFIGLLSVMNGVLALSAWAAAPILYRTLLSRPLPASADPADAARERLRTATLLCMALCEGAALLGVVVVFLAHTTGVLRADPSVWGNAATCLGLLLAAVACWPTERRLQELEERLRQASEG